MNRWRYRIEEDITYTIPRYPDLIQEPRRFCDAPGTCWLELRPPNQIIVKAGYAWDGCSPTISVFDLFWFGCPDGVMDITGRPVTWKASLIHDALGQYKSHPGFPFDRGMRDLIFLDLLAAEHFAPRHLYYTGVKVFGPAYDWYVKNRKHAER